MTFDGDLDDRSPARRAGGAVALATAQALSLTALVLWSALVDDAPGTLVWRLLLILVGVLWCRLRRHTRGITERSATRLDERDLARRNDTAWWGFTAAAGAGAVVGLTLLVGARMDSVDPRTLLDRSGSTLIALMLSSAALPSMLLTVLDRDMRED